jgi:hypothetical protein
MAKGFAGVNRSSGPASANPVEGTIVNGRVVDIILDETHPKWSELGQWNGIGTIEFTLLEQKEQKESTIAYPLFPQLKNYPLVNETVLLFRLPNRNLDKMSNIKSYYYINPVNLWNHPHHNAFPDIFKEEATDGQKADYQEIEGGAVRRIKDGSTDIELNSPAIGGTFVEKIDTHPILPFAGDNILEGRFGNSIRLGNTSKTPSKIKNNWSGGGNNGDPIIIIRNGQDPGASDEGWIPVVENINKDLSSIYLTSTQLLPLSTNKENYKAFNTPPKAIKTFNSPQIILKSGRIILNSSEDDILLNSKNKIALSSENEIGISSVKNVNIDANNIKIGSRFANQPIILGQDFMDQFGQLLITLKNLTSVLEGLQDWPGGSAVPNATVSPMASAAKNVIEEILNLVNDPKAPLLSSKSKVE